MAPMAKSKFGAPMFEPKVFRKLLYLKKVFTTLLRVFGALAVIRRPIVIWHPGNCAYLAPLVTPLIPTPFSFLAHCFCPKLDEANTGEDSKFEESYSNKLLAQIVRPCH